MYYKKFFLSLRFDCDPKSKSSKTSLTEVLDFSFIECRIGWVSIYSSWQTLKKLAYYLANIKEASILCRKQKNDCRFVDCFWMEG